ncbi:MAG: DUF3488 domain-containing protein [Phycisphaerae bacterium]|nr:DUF3488 domain-containing protein [Phycisphaerae bacterium]
MSLLLRYYRCVHLLVCLGILAYSVAEEDLVYALIAVPVAIAAYLIVGGPGGRPLPRWVINLSLLGATVAMAMKWTEPLGNTVSVLCSYLVWLQLIKLFEPRTPRDQSQVIILSLMLAVGACLTSVTAELGAVLVIYVPVLLLTVMLYQVYAAQARAAAPEPARNVTSADSARTGWMSVLTRWIIGTGGTPAHQHLPRAMHAGTRSRSDLSRAAWSAALIIAALAPFVYVGMPRGVGEAMFGRWQPANTPSVTGFRDHVQLGSQGLISESQRVVMKVKIEVSGRENPARGTPYRLRGAALDRYDDATGVWRRSAYVSSTDRRYGLGTTNPTRPSNPRGSLLLVQVTTIDQPLNRLFSVWRPLWVAWDTGARRETYVSNLYDGQMEVSIRPSGATYTVVCAPSEPAPPAPVPLRRAVVPPIADDSFIPITNRGEPMPEPPAPQFQEGPIHDLAARLLRDARISIDSDEWDARRRAVSTLARHLQSQYIYTTRMTAPPPGEDPIEMFLFDKERGGRGHCEYFASALAAMTLSLGIPARVVTGYVASEFDPASETYTIRENHAHAWVEAEVRPGLWEEFDPSPSAEVSRLHHPQGTVASFLRRALDALQFAWIEGVVTFDRERQAGTLQSVTLGPLEALRAFNQRIAAVLATEEEIAQDNQTVYWTRLAGWSVLLAIAILLLLHLAISRGLRLIANFREGGARRAEISRDPRLHQLTEYFNQMLRTFAEAGVAKPPHRPAMAHLGTLTDRHAAMIEPGRRLADLYYRARFAREPVQREHLDAARESLRALISAARAR